MLHPLHLFSLQVESSLMDQQTSKQSFKEQEDVWLYIGVFLLIIEKTTSNTELEG